MILNFKLKFFHYWTFEKLVVSLKFLCDTCVVVSVRTLINYIMTRNKWLKYPENCLKKYTNKFFTNINAQTLDQLSNMVWLYWCEMLQPIVKSYQTRTLWPLQNKLLKLVQLIFLKFFVKLSLQMKLSWEAIMMEKLSWWVTNFWEAIMMGNKTKIKNEIHLNEIINLSDNCSCFVSWTALGGKLPFLTACAKIPGSPKKSWFE